MAGLLDKDAQLVRDAVLELVTRVIAPRSAEYDRTGHYPRENMELLGEHGYLGMTVDPAYGGAGLSYLEQTLVVEALSFACPATAVVYEVHNSLHVEAVSRYGTDEQKRRWLPDLVAGRRIGAFALTEAEAGSNAAALTTVARPVDGGYRLTGRKLFITGAGHADAYLVFARLPGTERRGGITGFVVDRGVDGLRFGPPLAKMGLHASVTGEVIMDEVWVPEDHRLGAEGEGYDMALTLLEGGRIGIAAQACGLMMAALTKARQYAEQRRQFGQPIGHFEAVQFKLADMATDLHAARLMTYEAARHRDDPAHARLYASMAKVFASEAAVRHALNAIQIHGGYGYVQEYGVERLLRDAKVTEIYEGTSDIMRLVIGSQLLRQPAEALWEV
jgi:butyryl-CoA dehydrogenase